MRRVPEDSPGSARLAINENECVALDAVVPLPVDGEVGMGLFDMDRLGVSIPRQLRSEPIRSIQQPSIPCLRREKDNLHNGNDSSVVSGCALLNVAYLIGETKVPAVYRALARITPDGSSGSGHGTFHQAVQRSSRLCLSLLRPRCLSRLLKRTVTRGAGRALLSPGRRRSCGEQRGPE